MMGYAKELKRIREAQYLVRKINAANGLSHKPGSWTLRDMMSAEDKKAEYDRMKAARLKEREEKAAKNRKKKTPG